MRLEDANLDGLKGMPDVKYDFTVSSDLQAAFRAAASTLEGQRGSPARRRGRGGAAAPRWVGGVAALLRRGGGGVGQPGDALGEPVDLPLDEVQPLQDQGDIRADSWRHGHDGSPRHSVLDGEHVSLNRFI